MDKHLKKAFNRIKALKVQGASNVRKTIIKALKRTAIKSKAKTIKEMKKEIKKAGLYLAKARPTEPEARNAIRIIFHSMKGKNIKELRKAIIKACNEFELNREKALKLIAEIGAKKIKKNSIVLTHCHSHTVEEIIKKAAKQKKIKKVIATETRPKMQGHITAENLSKAGINVMLINDSAVSTFMKEADIVLVGADAIQADGSIINKIGTKTIALIAFYFKKPLYCCTSSLKFDPMTLLGKTEKIEEREAKEIWKKKIKKVKIRNPAFDVTEAKFVKGIISEEGILKPKEFVRIMKKKFS